MVQTTNHLVQAGPVISTPHIGQVTDLHFTISLRPRRAGQVRFKIGVATRAEYDRVGQSISITS